MALLFVEFLLGGTDRGTQRWIGIALMPQAGAAIGMALKANA